MNSPEDQKSENVQNRLQELRRTYARSLGQKMVRIEELWNELQTFWTAESLEELHLIVHGLAGSGGTFGFPLVGKMARTVEIKLRTCMDHGSPPDHQTIKRLQEDIHFLNQTLREPDFGFINESQDRSFKSREDQWIYIVDDNPEQAERIAIQLEQENYKVKNLLSTTLLEEAVENQRPMAILMDIMFPEGKLAGVESISCLQRRPGEPIPVIFFSSRDDIKARLEVVRAGGLYYFTKPIQVDKLLRFLELISSGRPRDPYKVLIVDDHKEQAEFHACVLRMDDMVVDVVLDPLKTIEKLDEFQPELILMDLYMPACNGLELAAVIRQYDRFINIPIVFLSTETHLDKQMAAMNMAGDGFLTKPIEPWHLRAAVSARLKRVRQLVDAMRETDAALKAAAKARDLAIEASQAKSLFLANMSHEIRTPMNGVLGFAQLLQDSNLSERDRQYVTSIEHSGTLMLELVEDILDLSKIEAGKLDLDVAPYDIDTLLSQIMSIMKPKADEKNLQLIIEKTHFEKNLMGDAQRIRQILLNLLSNAVKFTETGSITIKCTHNSTRLIISISDTGVGIPESQQSLIFESFTQASPKIATKFGGTGLGLTISRKLANLMTGELSFESEEGKGSTFHLILPLIFRKVQEKGTVAHTQVKQDSDFNGKSLLLVEDNPINMKLAVAALKRFNIKPVCASSGEEALLKLDGTYFDLVLLDCRLPKMDGYEVAKIIRNMDYYNKLPIIALTASVTLEERNLCFSVGMNDFLSKPFKFKELERKLHFWFQPENLKLKN